jgi:hypothetical protein
MLRIIKRFLGRFLPVPARTTHKQNQEISIKIQEMVERQSDIIEQHGRDMSEIKSALRELRGTVGAVNNNTAESSKIINEILWADIFNNTISESDWLKIKTFSPGRWAAGYPFLYILYRVLRDVKPKRILEMGLGETTRVISQYCSENQNAEHFVAEHDAAWVDFFTKSYIIPNNTKLITLPLIYLPYNGELVPSYENFSNYFANGTYDFICVDGPSGANADNKYARLDVLGLISDNLSDSFVILLDDYNQAKIKNMADLLLSKLKEIKIPYVTGVYRGTKDTFILCSEDIKFLKSL